MVSKDQGFFLLTFFSSGQECAEWRGQRSAGAAAAHAPSLGRPGELSFVNDDEGDNDDNDNVDDDDVDEGGSACTTTGTTWRVNILSKLKKL